MTKAGPILYGSSMTSPFPDLKPESPGRSIERAGIPVSDEQKAKLDLYLALLIRWQKAINLVSNKTLEDAGNRHFLDSAQIVPHIPEDGRAMVDLGSGAGFPGLVLAILRPGMEVHLIESDQKKCAFLETVSRETGTPVIVHCARIDSLAGSFPVDLVTARALAPLRTLLDHITPWIETSPRIQAVFLKGSDIQSEIQAAQGDWAFEAQTHKSLTDSQASLLCLQKIRHR